MSDTVLEIIREQVEEAVQRGHKSGELTNMIFLLGRIAELEEQLEEAVQYQILHNLRMGNFETVMFEDSKEGDK